MKGSNRAALVGAVAMLDGMTPKAIRALMVQRKIKGRPGTTGRCPLANLMHDMWGGNFSLGRKWIMRGSNGKLDRVATPPALAKFISEFDVAKYPELLAPLRDPRVRPKRPSGPSGPHKSRRVCRHPAKDVQR